MSVTEQIIQRVKTIKNPSILAEILSLISVECETDETYQLNSKERKSVLEGLKDADNGNVLSQTETDEMISKWLKERSSGR